MCPVPHKITDRQSDRILYRGSLDLTVYNRAELKSSDHRPVFALFKTVVWIVDQAKRDALARLLLENVTSTSNGEKLDEKLAALTLHPSTVDDRGYFDFVLEFCDLTQCPVPPPSSEDNAWWDRPGAYHYSSRRAIFHPPILYRPQKSRLNRSSKWRLRCYGSGRGAVSVNKPIRLTLGFTVVVFPLIIRRRAVHRGSAGPFNPRSSGCTCNHEDTASITFASEETFIESCGRI